MHGVANDSERPEPYLQAERLAWFRFPESICDADLHSADFELIDCADPGSSA